ncbi:uncharacterized protein LOC134192538 [Corticium candelabrum]|uniref:uncharacterized protein LOC134192538 n=1 Tax=Corticium candelabrum TaxID=121492 RepID=UPI002E26F5A1|nr:uncharacterized protein LOC134192538 [Corticium candelabrum]
MLRSALLILLATCLASLTVHDANQATLSNRCVCSNESSFIAVDCRSQSLRLLPPRPCSSSMDPLTVTSVDFSINQIKTVSFNYFKPYETLRSLVFEGNPLSTLFFLPSSLITVVITTTAPIFAKTPKLSRFFNGTLRQVNKM